MAIKFNLNTSLLDSVTTDNLVDVKLSLYCSNQYSGMEKLTAYEIKTEWKEMEATWSKATQNSAWQPGKHDSLQGGGDTTNKITTTPYSPENSWEHYTITEVFRSYLNGAPNNGFIIITDDKSGWCEATARQYIASNNNTQISLRPKITIKTTNTAIYKRKAPGNRTKNISYSVINGYMIISVPNSYCRIVITDMKGRKIYLLAENKKEFNIPLNKLGAGVNFLTIWHDKRPQIIKFINLK